MRAAAPLFCCFFKLALSLGPLIFLPYGKLCNVLINARHAISPQFLANPVAIRLYFTSSKSRFGSPPGGGVIRLSVGWVWEQSKLKVFGEMFWGGSAPPRAPRFGKKKKKRESNNTGEYLVSSIPNSF